MLGARGIFVMYHMKPCQLVVTITRCEQFARCERGALSIYVVLLSVLLLGIVGLVVDSGRVYSTHSRMQAFADHIALAAANELDGTETAIERASQAAYGVVSGSPLLTERQTANGDLVIAQLHFLSDLNEASGPQSDLSDSAEYLLLSTDRVVTGADPTLSTNAKFVTVEVQQQKIRSLSQFMSRISQALAGGGEGTDGLASVSANATARLDMVTCAELNTLAFCNPWEGMSASGTDANGNPLTRIEAENLEGRSLMFFAPNFDGSPSRGPVTNGRSHGSLYPWSVENQLVTVSDPVRDSTQACSLDYLQSYFAYAGENASSEDAVDYLEVRNRCLMARAEVEAVCYPDNRLGIRPASGPSVAAAVNTAFDIYNEPMDRVIAADEVVPATGLKLSELFEPDAVVTHPFERMVDLDADGDIDNDDYATFGHLTNSPETANAFTLINYQYVANPAPYMQHLPNAMVAFGGVHPCHEGTYEREIGGDGSGACAIDFVGDDSFGPAIGNLNAVANYYETATTRSIRRDVGSGPWYDVYRFEREQLAAGSGLLGMGATDQSHADGAAEGGPEGPPADGRRGDNIFDEVDPATAANDVNRLKVSPLDPTGSHDYPKWGPDQTHPMQSFAARTGRTRLVNPGLERRVLRAAFLNCRAATRSAPDDRGIYQAEVAAIVDVFLNRPAGIYCGTDANPRPLDKDDPTQFPVSLQSCHPTASVETQLFVETIGLSPTDPIERYTAELVR